VWFANFAVHPLQLPFQNFADERGEGELFDGRRDDNRLIWDRPIRKAIVYLGCN
jgi:hypothetical protein